jgi:hypothetical protein
MELIWNHKSHRRSHHWVLRGVQARTQIWRQERGEPWVRLEHTQSCWKSYQFLIQVWGFYKTIRCESNWSRSWVERWDHLLPSRWQVGNIEHHQVWISSTWSCQSLVQACLRLHQYRRKVVVKVMQSSDLGLLPLRLQPWLQLRQTHQTWYLVGIQERTHGMLWQIWYLKELDYSWNCSYSSHKRRHSLVRSDLWCNRRGKGHLRTAHRFQIPWKLRFDSIHYFQN